MPDSEITMRRPGEAVESVERLSKKKTHPAGKEVVSLNLSQALESRKSS